MKSKTYGEVAAAAFYQENNDNDWENAAKAVIKEFCEREKAVAEVLQSSFGPIYISFYDKKDLSSFVGKKFYIAPRQEGIMSSSEETDDET